MTIVFNGKETALAEGTTVAQFLKEQGLNPKAIVVEYNYEIAQEAEWGNLVLKANDTLEVLNFVGGG